MIKLRIYIDTSVVGACLDDEFKEYSVRLFSEFISGEKTPLVSDLLLLELEEAPEEIKGALERVPSSNIEYVSLDEESLALANAYIEEGAIAKRSISDARHIALATVERADILVSWNFRDIVNMGRIRLINSVNIKLGYPLLEIRSPMEVFYEG